MTPRVKGSQPYMKKTMRNKLHHFHVSAPPKCCTLKTKENTTPKLHEPWPTESFSLSCYTPHESEIAPKEKETKSHATLDPSK